MNVIPVSRLAEISPDFGKVLTDELMNCKVQAALLRFYVENQEAIRQIVDREISSSIRSNGFNSFKGSAVLFHVSQTMSPEIAPGKISIARCKDAARIRQHITPSLLSRKKVVSSFSSPLTEAAIAESKSKKSVYRAPYFNYYVLIRKDRPSSDQIKEHLRRAEFDSVLLEAQDRSDYSCIPDDDEVVELALESYLRDEDDDNEIGNPFKDYYCVVVNLSDCLEYLGVIVSVKLPKALKVILFYRREPSAPSYIDWVKSMNLPTRRMVHNRIK